MVLAGVSPHSNQGLFSDHYLEHHLPALTPDESQQAQRLRDEIGQLLTKVAAQAAGKKEANVEQGLIRPVLTKLGFVFEEKPPLSTAEAALEPDYALFADDEEKTTAGKRYRKPEYFAHVLALAEAKKWGLSLGATQAKKPRARPTHPGAQLRQYLAESGVRWGILTNGRVWRLYEKEASRGGQRFYEVDLVALLRQADPDAWRYFYQFFRRQAFERDAKGLSPVDRWLASSREYAVKLTGRLRGNVYEALRCLMEGFFANEDNPLRWDTDRDRVHDACLVLLYRLLFLLYAEARKLMPLEDSAAYRDRYSLQHRKQEIADGLDGHNGYDRRATTLWNWLQRDLFRLVDRGDERMKVPQYNGGLFRPERWPLLHDRNVCVADYYVARAIDLLARDTDPQTGAKGFVDYSELGVRELGSIYEGLLEMKPHLATEPMIEVKRAGKDKGPSIIGEAESTPEQKAWNQKRHAARYEPGQVYLLTDRGERKATGSYYTPEYIVNYIVEHTLDPLLSECAAKVAQGRPAIERRIKRLEKAIAERRGRANEAANRKAIEAAALELLEPYFQLKVLDPAMGSGHFLVGAAEFITDAILTDPNRIPPPEPNGEDEALYYKRRVVERCLYGVDLNPLAVELAKLSLWLHTVQKDRALSFLDHHLRCGNSLVGARVEEDLGREPPLFNRAGKQTNRDSQQPALGFYDTLRGKHLDGFLKTFAQIEERPTLDAASEREKDTLFRAMEQGRDPFRQVANLWLAPYFGVAVKPEQYEQAVAALRSGAQSPEWKALARQPWFKAVRKAAADRRFLHWELEFPEAFFTPTSRKREAERGFDAVVGNPPYGRVAESRLQSYVRSVFRSSEFKVDTYSLFVELGSRLVRLNGRCSLIVPNTLATNATERRLRTMMLRSGRFIRFLTFPGDVFDEAVVHSLVFVFERGTPDAAPEGTRVAIDRLGGPTIEIPLAGLLAHPGDQFLLFQEAEESGLVARLDTVSASLGGVLDIRQCIKTGDDARYLLCKGTRARHKPVLGGMHMDRYEIRPPESLFVDYGDWLACPRDPAIFEQPKVVVREAGARVACAKDEGNRYLLSSVYACVPYQGRDWPFSMDFLLAILNSSLTCWIARKRALESTAGAFTKLRIYQVESFPIRRIHFTTPGKERAGLAKGLDAAYEAWASKAADGSDPRGGPAGAEAILNRVESLLPKDPEGSFLAFRPGATGAEEKSDVVHDFLAYLAEQMTQMHKEKQAETRRFLQWLETEIGRPADDLRLKTKIRDYHARDAEALLDALKANDKALDRIAHRSAFQTDLRREFEKSMEVLRPLKARIAATDWLIDQVVYRLYGLTAEEVAIVEARPDADKSRTRGAASQEMTPLPPPANNQ